MRLNWQLFVLGVSTLAATTAAAEPTTWELDASHAHVSFSVRHMMISNVRGEFKTVTGSVTLDDKASPTGAEITIEAKSIDTRNAKRDEHLRSPDFFDVAKFPKITFKTTAIKKAFRGRYKVIGDLTIHGVTKSIELTVTEATKPVKDPWGMERFGVQAAGKVARKDFGMTWNKAMDKGGLVVGDDVFISIDAEFVKKAVPAAAAPAPAPVAK